MSARHQDTGANAKDRSIRGAIEARDFIVLFKIPALFVINPRLFFLVGDCSLLLPVLLFLSK